MAKIIKIVSLCFAILVCAVIIYWFGFQPLINKVGLTARHIEIKEAELKLIKTKVAHLADLGQTLRNVQAAEQASTQMIPAKLTLAELYYQIDSLTGASGLKVKQISTTQTFQPFKKDNRLKYITVNLEGNAFFPQVISFLDLVAKSNFLFQVENLDLSSITKGNKPQLHFKIALNAFEYSSDSI